MKDKNTLPGQITIEETEKPKAVRTVRVVSPIAAQSGSEASKAETEKAPTEEEKALARKAEWEKKQAEERERVKELRKKYKKRSAAEQSKEEEKREESEIESEEEDVAGDFSKKKQVNICKKYGIKHRNLKKAAAYAKKILAPKLALQFDSVYLIAIVELLTFGDI